MQRLRWLGFLLAVVFHTPLVALAPGQACSGCLGAGGTSSSSGGTCGGMVSIAIEVERGECGWYQEGDSLALDCRQKRGCSTTITRQWSDLPPGTGVEHGVFAGDERLHLTPAPESGSGADRTIRNGPVLDCGSDPSEELVFVIESKACSLSAQVRSTCSVCAGDL